MTRWGIFVYCPISANWVNIGKFVEKDKKGRRTSDGIDGEISNEERMAP